MTTSTVSSLWGFFLHEVVDCWWLCRKLTGLSSIYNCADISTCDTAQALASHIICVIADTLSFPLPFTPDHNPFQVFLKMSDLFLLLLIRETQNYYNSLIIHCSFRTTSQSSTDLIYYPPKESRSWNPENFCFWNMESQDILLMESGIMGFGIRKYIAQGIQNPTNNNIGIHG